MVPMGDFLRYRSRGADPQTGARNAKGEFIYLPRVWSLRDLEILSTTPDAGGFSRACYRDLARIRRRTRRSDQIVGAAFRQSFCDSLRAAACGLPPDKRRTTQMACHIHRNVSSPPH